MNYESLKPLVDQVSRVTSRNFPSYILEEDVNSAVWVWIMENKSTVSKIFDSGDFEAKIRRFLQHAANAYALKEDAAINGYSPEDSYVYSTEVVEELLGSVFDYTDWQAFGASGDGQPRSKKQANASGDRLAMLSDVKGAIKTLTRKQQAAIVRYYADHWTYDMIGAEQGITSQASRDRVERGVQAIRKALGRIPLSDLQRGHSGRLNPSTNAESRAWTERDYEG